MTDVASETVALLQRDSEFAAEASEGRDVEKVVSDWSAEAVVMPPGQPPVVGRDALRKYVEESYQIPGFDITRKATATAEFSSDFNMAYMCARNRVSFNNAEGNLITVHGRA